MSSLQKSIMEIADIRSLLLKQAVARSSNNSSDWDFSQVNKLKRRNERMVLAAVLLPIIDRKFATCWRCAQPIADASPP